MDLPIFLANLQALARFPEPLRQYAESVGGKLDDVQRSALMAKLEKEYAEFVVLDDKRMKREAEMMEELAAFKKKNLPALQRKIEAAEHDNADDILENAS